jgi:hypothetical protein
MRKKWNEHLIVAFLLVHKSVPIWKEKCLRQNLRSVLKTDNKIRDRPYRRCP